MSIVTMRQNMYILSDKTKLEHRGNVQKKIPPEAKSACIF